MLLPISVLHEFLAFATLLSFDSTGINVVPPPLNLKHLGTVLARLRPHLTVLLMLPECLLNRFVSAVLAFDLNVSLLLMLFLVCLGNDLATDLALVVDASALNLVHSELARVDLSLTVVAELSFFGLHHSSN